MINIPAASRAAGVSLEYSIGFGGYFQLNNWTPLSIVIGNRSRAVSGDLEVIVTSGSEYQGDVYRTIYTTEVDLPQNSQKRYAFTLIIQSFTHELIIRLRQDDEIIHSKSIILRSHFTDKNFALVADNFVAPDILSALPNHLAPAHVRPTFLPETWYGYNSVTLLILRADTIGKLRDRQFRALSQWLKQGGYLVINSGLNTGSLGDKRLQDILPIRVEGHQQLFDLTSLGAFCRRELTAVEPFLVLNTRIDDAKILVNENDIPIITQKKLGFGQIMFLSFDVNTPSFSRWDGRRMFWHKILSLQPKIDRPAIEMEDQQIVNSLLDGIPLIFPRFKSVVIFVCAYLFFLWLLLKKIKKPGKYRWRYSLSLILMIMIFTSIGYWGFYHPKLKQKFTYNSFCQLDVSASHTPALATYLIGLYSLKRLAYGLNFGSHDYPVTHIVSDKASAKTPNPYELQKKDGGKHIIGSLKRWSHIFYKLNLPLATPLVGFARRSKSFMTLTVENKLPYNLVDCLIYYQKRFLFVEDILASNRQIIKCNLADLKKKEIFGEHEVEKILRHFDGHGSASYLRNTQRNLTSDILFEVHDKYKSRPDSLILVGWMPAGLIQPEFNQTNPIGTGITMIHWELPVEITS